mmetsp:Transcript_9643/g.33164  ORF Transcript_9643/g.33164 Transcript_9643/m.33164 type:complete len:297 (+) Transcript_9643:400-1290(+)
MARHAARAVVAAGALVELLLDLDLLVVERRRGAALEVEGPRLALAGDAARRRREVAVGELDAQRVVGLARAALGAGEARRDDEGPHGGRARHRRAHGHEAADLLGPELRERELRHDVAQAQGRAAGRRAAVGRREREVDGDAELEQHARGLREEHGLEVEDVEPHRRQEVAVLHGDVRELLLAGEERPPAAEEEALEDRHDFGVALRARQREVVPLPDAPHAQQLVAHRERFAASVAAVAADDGVSWVCSGRAQMCSRRCAGRAADDELRRAVGALGQSMCARARDRSRGGRGHHV